MTEVKVLIQGYAKKTKNMMLASPSTVLIRDKGVKIIVDPGANEKKLLSALAKQKLKPKDIDYVFLTHYHPDHILNIRLFPGKDILDGDTIYRGDKEIGFGEKLPKTKIRVILTPGHAHEHACLLVETKDGRVCIAGDVFWWRDDEKQDTDVDYLLSHEDPYEKNHEELIKSRKKIIALADWIIPGHGKMFKVKK
jgi:glyoxylase-like metal-dependent hydrolase (beta-lactamase superfamily II)